MTQALTIYRRSALEDSACLHRFNEVHRKGVDDSSDYAIRGQAFAHIKHLYILALLNAGTPQDFDLAQQAFVQGIAEHQTPNRLIPELRELWIRHAEKFALDLDRYLTSEERQVGDEVSFTPDLVYAHPTEIEIKDDKTYWVVLSEDEVKATYQARFYVWQAMQRWPNFRSYRITFEFVRFNKATSVTFLPSEIDQMELEVKADMARIRHAEATGSWAAAVGPACRYCELKCPIADQEQIMPVRLTLADAPKIATWLIPAEKKFKGIKKTLKAWCVAHGPLEVAGGMVWGNWPYVERKYPLATVLEILKARNIMGAFEGTDGATLSHSALKKLFSQFPVLLDELKPYAQEKTKYRFAAKHPSDIDDGEDE